jgi:hypothetical protein
MHREVGYARRSARSRRLGIRAQALGADRAGGGGPRRPRGRKYLTPAPRGRNPGVVQAGAHELLRPVRLAHHAAARDPAAPRRRPLGQADRLAADDLGAHGRVPQVPDDGGVGNPLQRRPHPLRDQARLRRALRRRAPEPGKNSGQSWGFPEVTGSPLRLACPQRRRSLFGPRSGELCLAGGNATPP